MSAPMTGSGKHSVLKRVPALARIDRNIALAFGALVSVLMLVVLLVGGYYYRWVLEREEDQLASTVSHVLADSINRTFSGKYHTRLLVEEIAAKEPRIAYAMVVDPLGRVVAHSDPALNDTVVQDPGMTAAWKVLSGQERVIQNLRFRGEKVKEVALPFYHGYLEELNGVVRVGISTQETSVALVQGLVYLIAMVLGLLLVATVFIYRLSRSFGGPVKQMAWQMQAILDYAPVLISIRDRQGYLHEASASFRDLFNIGEASSEERKWQEFAPRAVLEATTADDHAVFDRGEVTHGEVRLRVKGDERVFMITKFPIARDARGRVLLICAMAHDVSERVRAEEALRDSQKRLAARQAAEAAWQQAQAELEGRVRERTAALAAANQELEAFSYSVSHDLRGPLRAINGYSGALQDDCAAALDEVGRNYLHRIQSATLHMSELIDGLLGLSRVFRSDLQTCEVDLSAFANAVARQLCDSEPERRVEFRIEPGLTAMGDATLLRLLVQNLLGNAWKFTLRSANARIEFLRVPFSGRELFVVRDNGLGFEMAYAHKLFQPFERLHTDAAFQGTGIGLATVRRIVQRHGGEIWAEGAPNNGAAFFFTLVAATECPVAREAV